MRALPGWEAALVSSIFYSGIIDLLFSLDNVRRSAYYDSRIQRPFGDGAHILYVNGENRDDMPLVVLYRYLNLIPFHTDDAAFVISISRGTRSADDLVAVGFQTSGKGIDRFFAADAERDMD